MTGSGTEYNPVISVFRQGAGLEPGGVGTQGLPMLKAGLLPDVFLPGSRVCCFAKGNRSFTVWRPHQDGKAHVSPSTQPESGLPSAPAWASIHHKMSA